MHKYTIYYIQFNGYYSFLHELRFPVTTAIIITITITIGTDGLNDAHEFTHVCGIAHVHRSSIHSYTVTV